MYDIVGEKDRNSVHDGRAYEGPLWRRNHPQGGEDGDVH